MTTSVFLVVHEISDDYHPIAGPPGEIFEISLYVKSRLYFGALRQITLVFWISDDYHPIAGPPGEIFEISLYVKSRLYFGALRQIAVQPGQL